jgi:pyrimidine operon attenuation protein/uracil phosphoribosyltransferase
VNTLPDNLDTLLAGMAERLQAYLREQGRHPPLMVGIHTGGAWLAERLHKLLALPDPLGVLNITFYRDDFSRIGLHPQVRPSELPCAVDDRHIVLVDDVLHTGRTVRAALNELFDYGRPASVSLAVLIERGGRELPIQADVAGCRLELLASQNIKLSGPDPLALVVQSL